MGVIGDTILEYIQPLLQGTDGSEEQLQKAARLGQTCWNLALMPDSKRAEAIAQLQSSLEMDDKMFAEFRAEMIEPMVERHKTMFPGMHRGDGVGLNLGSPPKPKRAQTKPANTQKYAGTGRNERCPCGSGKKYKVCCGG
jgi:uncharacterized protein YecA (UPF0149 family)